MTEGRVEYRHGDVALEGYLAAPEEGDGPRPGVLVLHQWRGVTEHEEKRARALAEAGFVALAADLYGKERRPETMEEAGALAGELRKDRQLMRDRCRAGLEELRRTPGVDPSRVAAIGYCFGGGAALELARSGADLSCVVSFHGNLDTPRPEDAAHIRGKVLVCHGAADPHVPMGRVQDFAMEMEQARVDWQLVMYGGAMHAFTHEGANDAARGTVYDEKADRRSWQVMLDLFAETF